MGSSHRPTHPPATHPRWPPAPEIPLQDHEDCGSWALHTYRDRQEGERNSILWGANKKPHNKNPPQTKKITHKSCCLFVFHIFPFIFQTQRNFETKLNYQKDAYKMSRLNSATVIRRDLNKRAKPSHTGKRGATRSQKTREAAVQLPNSLLGKIPPKILSQIQWNSPEKFIWKTETTPFPKLQKSKEVGGREKGKSYGTRSDILQPHSSRKDVPIEHSASAVRRNVLIIQNKQRL